MKRITLGALALLFGAVVLLALLFFKPWSDFTPARMNRIFHPDERVAHFRGMDRIFPSRTIAASSAPYRFEAAPAELPASYRFREQDLPLSDFLKRTTTTSLVVLRRGKLESELYMNGADANSRLTSWSVAKSFVVTLVGMAVKDGLIKSIDDPVSAYIPELKGKAYGDSSIRSVMQMASGIAFSEIYNDKLSDINTLFYKVFIFGQGINQTVAAYPRAVPAGTRFSYISVDTQVLAWLVGQVYRKPLSAIVQERLWQPLGMEASAFWSLDRPDGDELGYCCLNATARDFAKLGQLYLQDGQWRGQRLLPEGWVRMVTRPGAPWQEPGAPNAAQGFSNNGPRGYGMQFWVPKDYDGEFYANGIWGQSIWVSEKSGTVIVRTAVDPKYREHLEEMFAVMRTIAGKP